MTSARSQVTALLGLADVKVDGSRAQDITVHDQRLFQRLIRYRQLGLGEGYMDGWWDCKHIDEMIYQILTSNIQDQVKLTPAFLLAGFRLPFLNQQSLDHARRNAEHHYNIGNDLYERMLGKRMVYSCAYWQNAKNLDEAQEQKLELICKKLHLSKGMQVLDIGCGWGGFAEFAARRYGVHVTGISPAAEQVKYAKDRTEGLTVTILQKDYREITGEFDRVVSIGMLEHVGPRNYRTFFYTCNRLLKDDGIMLHHTIGANYQARFSDPWVVKYIFLGGLLPSLAKLSRVVEGKFIIEDVHNFGPDYDKTLLAWHRNFTERYHEIKGNYDERFYRMWEYYLLSFAGAFRARELQLWQIVMRKARQPQTYVSSR